MDLTKILIVHNAYQIWGGEDEVVEAETRLLRSYGHEVIEYRKSNHSITKPTFSLLRRTLWSSETIKEIHQLIEKHQPSIIHAHNTFPLISPSLYWVANKIGIPIIQTLHNFRVLCAQGAFLRAGRICQDCLGTLPWRGIYHKCYRGSVPQSTALVAMLGVHRSLGTYNNKVTRYIVLTEYAKQVFTAGGLPAEKLVIKPNFVDLPTRTERPSEGGLWVGRFSVEKGVQTLLDALQHNRRVKLSMIGTGPLRPLLEKHPQIDLLGWQDDPSDVYTRIRASLFMVIPSICHENFPRTLVEAFASGVPVIASRIGAFAELIKEGETGLLFNAGDSHDLARKIAYAYDHVDEMVRMGQQARIEYEKKYTSAQNYRQLLAIYQDASSLLSTRNTLSSVSKPILKTISNDI